MLQFVSDTMKPRKRKTSKIQEDDVATSSKQKAFTREDTGTQKETMPKKSQKSKKTKRKSHKKSSVADENIETLNNGISQSDQSHLSPPAAQSDETEGSRPTSNVRPSSPEPNCSICLGPLENKSFTDSCFHMFCFVCLLEWSKVKAVCPLCKQAFKSIIHNVRSFQDYDQYHLQTEAEAAASTGAQFGTYSDGRRFRYRSTVSLNTWHERIHHEQEQQLLALQRPTHRTTRGEWRNRRQFATSDFRRRVYAYNMRVKEVRTASGRPYRYREVNPNFFRANPACTHRLVPWLNRELIVLLSGQDEHSQFLLELILDLVKRFDITSEEFFQHIQPFIGDRTEHFVHEFYSFCRSPYDMIGYDSHAVYDEPNVPVHTVESSSNDTSPIRGSGSDSDVVLLSPGSPEPHIVDDSQPGQDHTYFDNGVLNFIPTEHRRGLLQIATNPTPLLAQLRSLLTSSSTSSTSFPIFSGGTVTSQSGWESPIPSTSGGIWSLTAPLVSSNQQNEPVEVTEIPLPIDNTATSDKTTAISLTSSPQVIDSGTSSESETGVEIVGYEKPWQERSPVMLSSDDEHGKRRHSFRHHKNLNRDSRHNKRNKKHYSRRHLDERQSNRVQSSKSAHQNERHRSKEQDNLHRRDSYVISKSKSHNAYNESRCSRDRTSTDKDCHNSRRKRSCSESSIEVVYDRHSSKHKKHKHERSHRRHKRSKHKHSRRHDRKHSTGNISDVESKSEKSTICKKRHLSNTSQDSTEKHSFKKHPTGHKSSSKIKNKPFAAYKSNKYRSIEDDMNKLKGTSSTRVARPEHSISSTDIDVSPSGSTCTPTTTTDEYYTAEYVRKPRGYKSGGHRDTLLDVSSPDRQFSTFHASSEEALDVVGLDSFIPTSAAGTLIEPSVMSSTSFIDHIDLNPMWSASVINPTGQDSLVKDDSRSSSLVDVGSPDRRFSTFHNISASGKSSTIDGYDTQDDIDVVSLQPIASSSNGDCGILVSTTKDVSGNSSDELNVVDIDDELDVQKEKTLTEQGDISPSRSDIIDVETVEADIVYNNLESDEEKIERNINVVGSRSSSSLSIIDVGVADIMTCGPSIENAANSIGSSTDDEVENNDTPGDDKTASTSHNYEKDGLNYLFDDSTTRQGRVSICAPLKARNQHRHDDSASDSDDNDLSGDTNKIKKILSEENQKSHDDTNHEKNEETISDIISNSENELRSYRTTSDSNSVVINLPQAVSKNVTSNKNNYKSGISICDPLTAQNEECESDAETCDKKVQRDYDNDDAISHFSGNELRPLENKSPPSNSIPTITNDFEESIVPHENQNYRKICDPLKARSPEFESDGKDNDLSPLNNKIPPYDYVPTVSNDFEGSIVLPDNTISQANSLTEVTDESLLNRNITPRYSISGQNCDCDVDIEGDVNTNVSHSYCSPLADESEDKVMTDSGENFSSTTTDSAVETHAKLSRNFHIKNCQTISGVSSFSDGGDLVEKVNNSIEHGPQSFEALCSSPSISYQDNQSASYSNAKCSSPVSVSSNPADHVALYDSSNKHLSDTVTMAENTVASYLVNNIARPSLCVADGSNGESIHQTDREILNFDHVDSETFDNQTISTDTCNLKVKNSQVQESTVCNLINEKCDTMVNGTLNFSDS